MRRMRNSIPEDYDCGLLLSPAIKFHFHFILVFVNQIIASFIATRRMFLS